MILDDVKTALRIKNTAYDSEITDLVAACKIDLGLAGIIKIDDTDAIIKRAIIIYCKANFGSNPDSEKYQRSYDMLKCSLALAGDYNTTPTT
jgi:hypothetical protein